MKKLISYKLVMIYLLAIFIGVMVGYLINVKDREQQKTEKNITYEQKITSQQEALAKKLISQSKLIFETKYLEMEK